MKISTVDGYCATQGVTEIDLLKIDAEGYDYRVLQGSSGSLEAKTIKLVLVECHFPPVYEEEASFFKINDFLESKGYKLVDFYDKAYKDNSLGLCNALFRIKKSA